MMSRISVTVLYWPIQDSLRASLTYDLGRVALWHSCTGLYNTVSEQLMPRLTFFTFFLIHSLLSTAFDKHWCWCLDWVYSDLDIKVWHWRFVNGMCFIWFLCFVTWHCLSFTMLTLIFLSVLQHFNELLMISLPMPWWGVKCKFQFSQLLFGNHVVLLWIGDKLQLETSSPSWMMPRQLHSLVP